MSTEFKEFIAVIPLKELLRQLWLNMTLMIINSCVNLSLYFKNITASINACVLQLAEKQND